MSFRGLNLRYGLQVLSSVLVIMMTLITAQGFAAENPADPSANKPSANAGPLRLPPPANSNDPNAPNNAIVLAHFRDPKSNENVDIVAPQASPEELAKHSPAMLAKEDAELRARLKAQCSKGSSVIGEVVHKFPEEATAFYTGLAMSAQLQMRSDPAAFQHFYQQNITNVMGHVSFAFFMLGSRMTTSAMSMMGLAFDPCHELKRTGRLAPTLAQKRFAHLMGPLSMSSGFLLSSLANEFLSDQNIRLCALGLVKTLDADKQKQRDAACTQAYGDWVSSKKILNYVPDLISQTITSSVQAYLIQMPLSWGASRIGSAMSGAVARALLSGEARTVTIRALEIALSFAPGGLLVRLAVQAAGTVVFMTLNDYISPYIKFPWERWMQGKDITAAINDIYSEIDRVEKNDWIWTPKPPPKECTYEPTATDYMNGYVVPYYCDRKTQSMSDMIGQMNELHKKWRQTVLADAYTAHSNWTDYISHFQNTYADAYRFYGDILRNINYKNTPGAAPSQRVEKMYSTMPSNGLDAGFFTNVCSMPDDKKKVFKDATDYAAKALNDLKSKQLRTYDTHEIEQLEKVYAGLLAYDCTQTPPSLQAQAAPAAGVSADQQTQAVDVARGNQVRGAIDTINSVLNGTGPLAHSVRLEMTVITGDMTGLNPIVDTNAVPARSNPFYGLQTILGDSRPQSEGAAYLTDMEGDETIINQDMKNEHPGTLGSARTTTMSNFLLASMVCGPQLSQDPAVESHPTDMHKHSFIWKFLDSFGIGFDQTNRLIDSRSMIYVEYDSKDAGDLLTGIYGVRADFRPPGIVKLPGADAGRNLCKTMPRTNFDPMDPSFDPRAVEFDLAGKHFKSLLDVVKNFADPAVMGADKDHFAFPQFWAKAVDTHVLKVLELYRNNFKAIVQKDFLPNFVRQDNKTYNGRVFEVGTEKSLLSQTHFNLLLLGKSLFPKTSTAPTAADKSNRQQFIALAKQIEKLMSEQMDLLSYDVPATMAMQEIEARAVQASHSGTSQNGTAPLATDIPNASTPVRDRLQKDFDLNQAAILALLTKAKAVPNMRAQVSTEANKTLAELGDVAGKGIEGLVTETGTYFGIIDTVRVEGLE